MPNKSFSSMLPKSFLESVEQYRISPLSYVRKDGSLAYLPFVGGGAEDDDNDAGAGSGSDDKGGAGAEGSNETGDDSDEDEDADGAMPDNIKKILLKNRRITRDAEAAKRAAEKAAAEALAKAKEYEDKDKSELEKLTAERDELKAEREKLAADNKRLALQQAFHNDKSVTWKDPEDALDLALSKYGLGDVEISEDGRVDAKAIKKLVKELSSDKSYLVESEAGTGGDDKGQQDKGKKHGPSGRSYNGGKSGDKAKDEAAMRRRFPAMGGRRRTD